ncbi:MAG: response regulator [Deltaproteobacteria bacterium]|nr:response regulator [Deltaproteobacteria bacterium]
MPKILLIDDDIDVVEAMKIVLESKGYRVLAAYDGGSGYKKAEEENPDLIILDVVMKTKDEGFQTEKLRDIHIYHNSNMEKRYCDILKAKALSCKTT